MRALALLLLLMVQCAAFGQTVVVYARADGAAARRVVQLVKLYDAVVIDVELRPGVPWSQEIDSAIDTAAKVLVLWSARSARSPAVQYEWHRALNNGRMVVPVLLDSTPMPTRLGARQGVDWRAAR